MHVMFLNIRDDTIVNYIETLEEQTRYDILEASGVYTSRSLYVFKPPLHLSLMTNCHNPTI